MDAPFLLVGEGLRVAPGRRVLKAAEYTALADAQGLLDAARESARASAQRALDEAQEERRRGFREGADDARREAATTLAAIGAGAARTLARIEPLLAEAVMTALRGVLDEAPATVFYDAVLRKIARFVRDQRFLTLRVAPQDEAAARTQIDALHAQGVFAGLVDIQVDATLAPLSAVMSSESGTVDASLDLQLEGLRAALEREAAQVAASIVDDESADANQADRATGGFGEPDSLRADPGVFRRGAASDLSE
ncbi:type III secretion system stator protein SctL [Paraburkholderia madseniana]|nr:type III secretion system stator protein SctL [Paraburkholderia madseniana]